MELIRPDWPAPGGVCAAVTTRLGGVSRGSYAGLNLGDHVGDDPAAVVTNRARLAAALALPGVPLWLEQVHGCRVLDLEAPTADRQADAAFSTTPGRVCAVLSADCLPVLLCTVDGSAVAAVHAGWRGLAAGVIEATVARFCQPPGRLLAWLGPAIGPDAFEVGDEVRARFLATDAGAEAAFHPAARAGHWLADLFALARRRLQRCGVQSISGGYECTWSQPQRFFSYRRDGITGRMASLIWRAADDSSYSEKPTS